MKRIAVLSSGGDAPGMNAAIRAVVRRGDGVGLEVYGVRAGYQGLIGDDIHQLRRTDVRDIIHRGGTILHTSRCPEFHTREGRQRAADSLARHGIEGLVVIGGDGSYRGAHALSLEHGVTTIGIPGTIDNDIGGSDVTIGFDTAVNTATEAIDRLRDTAESHQRLFFVEVMGRTTGHIAAHVGIAGGAEEMLVPEIPTDLEGLAERLRHDMRGGKRSAIVIVAEGDNAGSATEIAAQIGAKLGYDTRVCVLGHIQRGGRPTARDRVLASCLGAMAVDLLVEGTAAVALGVHHGRYISTPLAEVERAKTPMDADLVRLARHLAG